MRPHANGFWPGPLEGHETAPQDGDILADLFRAQPVTTYSASQQYPRREGSPIPHGITVPFPIASLAPSPPPKPRSSAADNGHWSVGAPASVVAAQFIPVAGPSPSAGKPAGEGASAVTYTSQVPRAGFLIDRDGPVVGMPIQHQVHQDTFPAYRQRLPEQVSTLEESMQVPPEDEQEWEGAEPAVLKGYNPNAWSPPLRYGDTIVLLVEGYNAMVAYGSSSDGRAWIQFLREHVGVPPNFRDCQFKIQPIRNYVGEKKLKNFLQESDWNGGKNIPLPEYPPLRAHEHELAEMAQGFAHEHGLEDYVDQIKELLRHLHSVVEERHADDLEQKRLLGKEIRYGMTCVLVHCATGKILTVTKQRALASGSKKVALDQNGNNRSALVLRPAFKTYTDGSAISSGDMVSLVSKKTISGSQFKLNMGQVDVEQTETGEADVKRHLAVDHVYIEGGVELNACTINSQDAHPTLFRMLQVREQKTEADSSKIRGEDVVTFYHKQAGAFLHFDPMVHDKPFYYRSDRVSERQRKKCHWMWKLEGCHLCSAGEPVFADDDTKVRYRIKHVVTNLYLMQTSGTSRIPRTTASFSSEADNQLQVTDDYQDQRTLFSFRQFAKDAPNHHLETGEMAFVRASATGDYVVCETKDGFDDFAQSLTSPTPRARSRSPERPRSPVGRLQRAEHRLCLESSSSNASPWDGIDVVAPPGADGPTPKPGPPRDQGRGRLQDFPQSNASETPGATSTANELKFVLKNRILPARMSAQQLVPDSDALLVLPVNKRALDNVLSVRQYVLILQDYARELEKLPDCTGRSNQGPAGERAVLNITTAVMDQVQEALEKLVLNLSWGDDSNPMSRDGRPNRLMQKILRELSCDAVVVNLLELPFRKGVDIDQLKGNDKFAPLVGLLNRMYRLLKQMAKGNLNNCRRILIHLQVFRSQLGKGILITPTVKEIFSGKRELLNALPQSLVDHYGDLLMNEAKAPQYIDFLMSICTCGPESNPEPLSNVQDMVTNVLLDMDVNAAIGGYEPALPKEPTASGSRDSTLVTNFRIEKNGTGITMWFRHPGGKKWRNAADWHQNSFTNPKTGKIHNEDYASWIMNAALTDLTEEQKIFRYMIRCTSLFGRLTLGRNQRALKLLICNPDLCLDYESILNVMREESLPYILRASYTTLMARLFLDRDPQTQNPSIMRTRVWSQVEPEKSDLVSNQVNDVRNPIPTCTNGFVDLQAFLLSNIPKVAGCKDQRGKSNLNGKPCWAQLQLVQAQLELADMMLRFGFFQGPRAQRALPDKATATASLGFSRDLTMMQPQRANTIRPRTATYAPYDNIRTLFEGLWSVLDSRDSSESHGSPASTELEVRDNVRVQAMQLLARSTESEVRNNVRVQAMQILARMIDIRINHRVSNAIECYEKIFEEISKDEKALCSLGGSKAVSGTNFPLVTSSSNELPSNMTDTSSAAGNKCDWDNDRLSLVFAPFQDKVKQLETALFEQNIVSPIEISADTYQPDSLRDHPIRDHMVLVMLNLCSFNDEALSTACLSLLFRHMSQRPALLDELKNIQILVFPQAARVYKEVSHIIVRFSACMKLINKSASREQSKHVKETPSQEEVQREQDAYTEVSKLLQRMTNYLTITRGQKSEVVKMYQSIMLNLEVDTPVRRFLELNLRRDTSRREQGDLESDTPGSVKLRDLFQDVYTFLKCLTKGNAAAQKRMFQFILQFAEHMGIDKLNVSDTILEVVKDNPKLSARVGEQLFSKFINAIKTFGRRARWLNFFQPFMIINGKTAVTRNQDVIFRLLLEDKEAILDLTCNYKESQYLSKTDTRYGKTRIELLLENEHQRPLASLLNYHVATLRTLASCCFGKNADNIHKLASVISFSTAVDNILDMDKRDDGTPEPNIDPDAIRFVQIGWVALLADVHFSCSASDVDILKDVQASGRLYNDARGKSLLVEFSTNTAVLKVRLAKLDTAKYLGMPSLLENVGDDMGHNLGSHLELLQEIIRATKLLLRNGEMFLQSNARKMIDSPEVGGLQKNMVSLYPLLVEFRFMQLAKMLGELIAVMNEAGVKGDQLVSCIEVPNKQTEYLGKEFVFTDGFRRFHSYLYLTFGVDPKEGHTMDVPIKDITRLLGSKKTYMNNEYQSLEQFLKMMQSRDADEGLLLYGLKVLRAIVYMRPGDRLTPEQEEEEYKRHLDNEFSSFAGKKEHLEFQEQMARIGMVDVVVWCCQHENKDIVLAALHLAVALLDGGNKTVQRCFGILLKPASSLPFFRKIHSLFAESQQSLKEEKKRAKQDRNTQIALRKAGIRAPKVDTKDQAKTTQSSQGHMTEVMKMMRRCCQDGCELQNVWRIQRLNAISYNFFVEAVAYLEAIEPDLKDAFDSGVMDPNSQTWKSPMADSVMRGFLMLGDSMTGPNVENQKVISETNIFDVCDHIFTWIKFEDFNVHLNHEHSPNQNNAKGLSQEAKDRIKAKNELKSRLKLAITRFLEGFLGGIHDDSIVKQMISKLNWEGFGEQMQSCYHAKFEKGASYVSEELCLEEGCSYYRLIVHCKHYDKANAVIVPAMEDVPPKILQFFEHHTGMIEIVRHSLLERVYFQLPTEGLKGGYMDRPEVAKMLFNADREDFDKKARKFIDNMCERVHIEQFSDSIRKSPLSWTVTQLQRIRIFNFVWTLSIHIIMVNTSYMPNVGFWESSFREDYQERIWIEEKNPVALGFPEDAKFEEYCGDWCDYGFPLTERDKYFFYDVMPVVETVLRYMSYINLATCGLRFFAFCWSDLPNTVRRDLTEQRYAELDQLDLERVDPEQEVHEDPAVNDTEDASGLVWIEKHTTKKNASVANSVEDDDADGSQSEDLRWKQLKSALTAKGFYYEAAFVIFQLIASFTDESLFSFYCLMEILFWEGSAPVVNAVAINAGKMMQLVVLGVLCIYVWLVVGLFLLHDAHAQDFCSNMFQCFMSYIDISIRAYGVHETMSFVGESFKYPHNIVDALGVNEDSRSSGVFLLRLIWDASFQILFGYIIIVGIIPGIIIDAFGELKSRREMEIEDLNQVCFVCSARRSKVDQEGIGFDKHIKYEHNPRHYLYFLVNLQKRTRSQLTDAEKYVYSKVWPEAEQKRDISWLPREQAMTMHKSSEETEAELHKLITQVDELKSDVSQQMLKMGDKLEVGLKIAEKIVQGATGVNPARSGTSLNISGDEQAAQFREHKKIMDEQEKRIKEQEAQIRRLDLMLHTVMENQRRQATGLSGVA